MKHLHLENQNGLMNVKAPKTVFCKSFVFSKYELPVYSFPFKHTGISYVFLCYFNKRGLIWLTACIEASDALMR